MRRDNYDCFHYPSWRKNVVIAFGTLACFLNQIHISGVVCVVCASAGDEKLENIDVDLVLLKGPTLLSTHAPVLPKTIPLPFSFFLPSPSFPVVFLLFPPPRVCVCVCASVCARARACDDNDCFHYPFWRKNVVIAFGTLSFCLTQLHIVSGVVCVVCPFAGDEKLKNIHVDLVLLV